MATSTKYKGNPFISRRERQETIILYNRLAEEVNKKAVFVSRRFDNVKVEAIKANVFTTAGNNNDYTCRLFFELRDGLTGYQEAGEWTGDDAEKWTIQAGKDYFVYNTHKYMIQSLTEKKNINGGIDILEVLAK